MPRACLNAYIGHALNFEPGEAGGPIYQSDQKCTGKLDCHKASKGILYF